jgi:hypothetical protein
LPQPLPPMITKTSPRFTVKLRSRITTKSPNAIVRSRTMMCGSPTTPWVTAERVVVDWLTGQMSSRLNRKAMMPQATTIHTIPVTTARVAASPTAEELRPHWKPRKHPEIAIITP